MAAKKVVVRLDNRTVHAIVNYRTDDARLSGLPVITTGEWDARLNKPSLTPSKVTRMHDTDFEFECEQCNRVISHDDAIDVDGRAFCPSCATDLEDSGESDEHDDEDDLGDDPSFTLNDNKIFVTTDFGESYGPFDTIMEAIGAVQEEMGAALSDVRTLTIGFRLVRDGLSETAKDELDAGTIPF